jgi:hypothetical protein
MTIREKRRAWERRVAADPQVSHLDRQLTLAVAGTDRRGIVFRQINGEFFFESSPRYAARLTV